MNRFGRALDIVRFGLIPNGAVVGNDRSGPVHLEPPRLTETIDSEAYDRVIE
jgi:hypothetical protein